VTGLGWRRLRDERRLRNGRRRLHSDRRLLSERRWHHSVQQGWNLLGSWVVGNPLGHLCSAYPVW
jgi:hypothetical protein